MKNRAIFCRQRRSATSFWFVFSCTSGLIAELALFPLGDRHTPWSCSTPATSKDPRPTGTSLWWLQVAFCISGRQLALLVCLFCNCQFVPMPVLYAPQNRHATGLATDPPHPRGPVVRGFGLVACNGGLYLPSGTGQRAQAECPSA